MMNMTKRKLIYRAFGTLLFILAATSAILISTKKNQEEVRYEVIPSGNGWGYNILIGKKVFIHQPYIPAVPGEKTFPDKQSARRVAQLVIGKINRGESPSVTLEELSSEDGKGNFQID